MYIMGYGAKKQFFYQMNFCALFILFAIKIIRLPLKPYDIMSVQQRAGVRRKSCFVSSPQIGCGAPVNSEIVGSHGHIVSHGPWWQVSGRIVARMGDVTLASWTLMSRRCWILWDVHQPIFGIVRLGHASHSNLSVCCLFSFNWWLLPISHSSSCPRSLTIATDVALTPFNVEESGKKT